MKQEIPITYLIYLLEQTDNIFLTERLRELRDLILTTPNDFELGEKIRKLL